MKTWFWFGFAIMLLNAVLSLIATISAATVQKKIAYKILDLVIHLTLCLEFIFLGWSIWGSTIVWDKAGVACSEQITTSLGDFMTWWIVASFTWIGLWLCFIVCYISDADTD